MKPFTLYEMVPLEEGTLVQYLGVYVTRWRQEWGEPTVAFVEVEEGQDQPLVSFWLSGQPPRKSNSRTMAKRVSKAGNDYLAPIKSKKALNWCESAACEIPRAARLGLGTAKSPVSVVFHVFYKTRKPDLSIELILDVLQKNGVLSDDRHVYHYEAFKHFNKNEPGVHVQIYPYEYDAGEEFHGAPWSDDA